MRPPRFVRVCPTCDRVLVLSVTGRTPKTPLGTEVFACAVCGPVSRWLIRDAWTGAVVGHGDAADGGRLLGGIAGPRS
jgi:hypothetical protein